ncbi:DUF2690 domain-containing protein [Streptomyces sp. NPDC048751]|uniref:DUF2690 domain-containing protein n=1 Tax=Streptomyces sp. NPDC048751 TaxID=3365591 RepID=UPI00372462E2
MLCRAAWARVWNTAVGNTLGFTGPGQPKHSVTVARLSDATGFVYTDLVAVAGPPGSRHVWEAPPARPRSATPCRPPGPWRARAAVSRRRRRPRRSRRSHWGPRAVASRHGQPRSGRWVRGDPHTPYP